LNRSKYLEKKVILVNKTFLKNFTEENENT